jgi:hypothetical protein
MSRRLFSIWILHYLPIQPRAKHLNDIVQLRFAKCPALRNKVPFCQTGSAARACCVLSDECGVAAHGGLAAIVRGFGGGQALGEELPRVLKHGGQAFGLQVLPLLRAEPEAAAEAGFG